MCLFLENLLPKINSILYEIFKAHLPLVLHFKNAFEEAMIEEGYEVML